VRASPPEVLGEIKLKKTGAWLIAPFSGQLMDWYTAQNDQSFNLVKLKWNWTQMNTDRGGWKSMIS
jgi:hypothetical protein